MTTNNQPVPPSDPSPASHGVPPGDGRPGPIHAVVQQICVHAKLVERYHEMGVPRMQKYLDLLLDEVKQLDDLVSQ